METQFFVGVKPKGADRQCLHGAQTGLSHFVKADIAAATVIRTAFSRVETWSLKQLPVVLQVLPDYQLELLGSLWVFVCECSSGSHVGRSEERVRLADFF